MSDCQIVKLPILDKSPFDTFMNWYNKEKAIDLNPISDANFSNMNLRNIDQAKALQAEQLNNLMVARSLAKPPLKDGSFTDGSIMMEGVFDHGSRSQPSEYFMSTFISPYKLAILARFTSLGWRICYEFAQDVWYAGLGVNILGKNVVEISRDINIKLKDIFRELNFIERMELATGFAREQGQSLCVLYYEGEFASDIGTEEGKVNASDVVTAYEYMSKPAPTDRDVAKIEVFNRQYYFISKDDGKGNPLEFKVSAYLGRYSGRPQIPIHHSRCVWIKRTDVERDFEGHSVIEPCNNELVITTNILKACGEIAFRWGTGHPVILTKGLSPAQSEVFKSLLGNPIRKDWHVFPSEMVETFDLISQKSGMVDLPALGDFVIGLVVASTGIPRPILMGEVSGVVTGGEVNERSYFALLDKEHSNLEGPVVELFEKIRQIKKLLTGYDFAFNWGIRQSMSAMEQMDVETKKIANIISKVSTFLPLNQGLSELGYPNLEDMVEPEFKDYAKKLGNSVLTYTVFDLQAQKDEAALKQKQLENQNFQQKAISGNQDKGKGKGQKWNKKGEESETPNNPQKARAASIGRVKNKVGVLLNSMRMLPDYESVPKLAKDLEMSPTTFYKMEKWKNENPE